MTHTQCTRVCIEKRLEKLQYARKAAGSPLDVRVVNVFLNTLASKFSSEFLFLLQLRKTITIVIRKYCEGAGAAWLSRPGSGQWAAVCLQSVSPWWVNAFGLRAVCLYTSWLDTLYPLLIGVLAAWQLVLVILSSKRVCYMDMLFLSPSVPSFFLFPGLFTKDLKRSKTMYGQSPNYDGPI